MVLLWAPWTVKKKNQNVSRTIDQAAVLPRLYEKLALGQPRHCKKGPEETVCPSLVDWLRGSYHPPLIYYHYSSIFCQLYKPLQPAIACIIMVVPFMVVPYYPCWQPMNIVFYHQRRWSIDKQSEGYLDTAQQLDNQQEWTDGE